MNYKVLIAEDDRDIVEILKLYLENEKYEILTAEDGAEALNIIKQEHIDIAVVDIMMPKMNGYELIKSMRTFTDIPVIILSAQINDCDKILGLNVGADDYMTKPFNPLEIVARIKANLRRTVWAKGNKSDVKNKVSIGNLVLDTEKMVLIKDGEIVNLTSTEYKILAAMMRSPGRVFTKTQLYEKINGELFDNEDNIMMVHISKLREKMDPYKYIKTVRGLGYKIEDK
ncbi:MAG: response regulator transcription factor [Anaerovoracaceae bacterium]